MLKKADVQVGYVYENAPRRMSPCRFYRQE